MKINYIKYGASLAVLLVVLCLCIYIFEKGKALGEVTAINH